MICSERVLIAGWFSFPGRKATFGDVQAMEVLTNWLMHARIAFDVAGKDVNGVDLGTVDPFIYDTFVFICGPWGRRPEILKRFEHCRMIGINLSVRSPDHGFDKLFARDSVWESNPDLVFNANSPKVPVVGIALVHPQPIYGDLQRHERVGEAVKRFLANSGVATIPLDTLIYENRAGLSTAAQLEALIRSCDVVLTSRLHGMVYSLKNGVPAVAIDAIAGGAKVAAQARTLGWPFILDGDCVTAELIAKNVCDALKSEVRELVRSVTARAQTRIEGMRAEIVLAFNGG